MVGVSLDNILFLQLDATLLDRQNSLRGKLQSRMKEQRRRGHSSTTVDAAVQSDEAKIQTALMDMVQRQSLSDKQQEERKALEQLVTEPSQQAAILQLYDENVEKLKGKSLNTYMCS